MNNIKALVKKLVIKINQASNKKILTWSIVLLLLPFVLSYLCEGLINLSAWTAETAILKIGPWASIISWPFDQAVNLMLSPFVSALWLALFPLAAFIGAILLIKTKGQSLAGLFVTSMGLVLSYAFIFMA